MPDSTKRILTDETGQDIVSALQSLQGVIDPNGTAVAAAAKIDNMTVAASSLATGATPTATVSEVNGHKHIAFGIPTGATGATPQLSIGTVSTVAATENAVATLSGTTAAPVLNLQIPRGVSGNESIDDTKGIGDTDYVWSADKSQKEVNGLDGKKANSENLYLYKEASGSVITVDDAVAEAVKQMQIEIAPVQDLHGYDHPWPAGGGKNILVPSSLPTGPNKNINVTKNDDGVVHASGSNSDIAGFYVQSSSSIPIKAGQYTISVSVTGTTNLVYFRIIFDNAEYKTCNQTTSVTFTLDQDDTYKVAIFEGDALTNANIDIYAQLESGASSSEWSPYANICPIYGWTGANVMRTRFNQWDEQWEVGYRSSTTGEKVNTSVAICSKNPIKVLPGMIYYGYIAGFTNLSLYGQFYDLSMNFIEQKIIGSRTFVTPNNAYYMHFNTDASITTKQGDICINFSDSAKNGTYEPYRGSTYSITFPPSAGTVYGGTLDVTTGLLTVDSFRKVLNGTEPYTSWSGEKGYIPGNSSMLSTTTNLNCCCTHYNRSNNSAFADLEDFSWLGVSTVLYFHDSRISSVEEFQAFLADQNAKGTPVTIVAKLVTPVTYTLTAPEVITLLSGLNNIWSDTGDILSMLYPVDNKADKDGEYEHLVAGSALQLLGQYTDENVPYVFRKTPVNSKRVREKLVGGTVAWNQLANSNFQTCSDKTNMYAGMFVSSSGIALTLSVIYNHKYLFTFVQPSGCSVYKQNGAGLDVGGYAGYEAPSSNKIIGFMAQCTETKVNQNYNTILSKLSTTEEAYHVSNVQVFDLTQMFGSAIADAIYAMEQATTGSGVAWFRSLFPKDYYEYNAGELMSVQAVSKVTTGFNQWDEEWESGFINSSGVQDYDANNIRAKNFIPCLPNTTYYWHVGKNNNGRLHYYDINKNWISGEVGSRKNYITPENCYYIKFSTGGSYGGTYNHDICINISDPAKNGTYEPYSGHTYPFDPNLTLRGIPKWDSTAGKMYYDGDEYEADGKVNRRYGIVDLGTLAWAYSNNSTNYYYFYAAVPNKAINYNFICEKYVNVNSTRVMLVTDKTISCYANSADTYMKWVAIRDDSYTDVAAFTTAMSGVYLVYELATPTTETADPYQEVQICDGNGTEEFVDGGNRDVSVPVGHESKYSADIWQIVADLQAAILALQS